jgi:hypothetical protein
MRVRKTGKKEFFADIAEYQQKILFSRFLTIEGWEKQHGTSWHKPCRHSSPYAIVAMFS